MISHKRREKRRKHQRAEDVSFAYNKDLLGHSFNQITIYSRFLKNLFVSSFHDQMPNCTIPYLTSNVLEYDISKVERNTRVSWHSGPKLMVSLTLPSSVLSLMNIGWHLGCDWHVLFAGDVELTKKTKAFSNPNKYLRKP